MRVCSSCTDEWVACLRPGGLRASSLANVVVARQLYDRHHEQQQQQQRSCCPNAPCACRAAGAGQLEAIRLLLEQGRAKVGAQDRQGDQPLHLACAGGHTPAAALLAAAGADVEVRGGSLCG
jgi:hypothetical protein